MTFNRVTISSLFMALHFHGIGLYFVLTGIVNFKPSWLTASYQLITLIGFLVFSIRIKEYKKKLTKIRLFDIFYILFIVISLFEMRKLDTSFGYLLPLYFFTYSLSLILLRATVYRQVLLIFQYTTVLTSIASVLSLIQFLSGNLGSVADGRIYLGTSGNPIIAGYVGAYTLSCCFLLFISKKLSNNSNIILCISGISGLAVCMLSGTRSSMLFAISSMLFILCSSINFRFSKSTKLKIFPNHVFLSLIAFGSLILIILFTAGNIELSNYKFFQSISYTFNRLFSTFTAATSDGSFGASALGRVEDYERTYNAFVDQPIFGNGVYKSGYAHNFALQVAADFGVLGICLFIVPFFIWIYQFIVILFDNKNQHITSFRSKEIERNIFKSYFGIVLLQTLFNGGFHGDLYRSFFVLAGVGILLSMSTEINHDR